MDAAQNMRGDATFCLNVRRRRIDHAYPASVLDKQRVTQFVVRSLSLWEECEVQPQAWAIWVGASGLSFRQLMIAHLTCARISAHWTLSYINFRNGLTRVL